MNEQIFMWIIGGQTTVILGVLVYIIKRIDNVEEEIKQMRLDMHNIDKRLYGVESLLHMQDCCVLKEDKTMKKAE